MQSSLNQWFSALLNDASYDSKSWLHAISLSVAKKHKFSFLLCAVPLRRGREGFNDTLVFYIMNSLSICRKDKEVFVYMSS